MNHSTHSGKSEPEAGDDEYTMPCAEAILAGTLALITGHARCGCTQHRDMMAKKAASNLALLAQHPLMSAGFKTVAAKLHEQWVELIHAQRVQAQQVAQQSVADVAGSACMSPAEQSRALWHTTPEVIQ